MNDALTSERWLPVVDWEGLYDVSDLGRVRSLPRRVRVRGNGTRIMGGQLLKPRPESDGRQLVSLSRENNVVASRICILVLKAFVGPRPPGLVACHGNDIPSDDRLVNLRWDTESANAIDRVVNGNDPHCARTHCPLAHPLQTPNLVASRAKFGYRVCLACARARSYVRDHPAADLGEVAMGYLSKIHRGDPSKGPW